MSHFLKRCNLRYKEPYIDTKILFSLLLVGQTFVTLLWIEGKLTARGFV